MLRFPPARPVASHVSKLRGRSLGGLLLITSVALVASLLATGVVAGTAEPPSGGPKGKWVDITITEHCRPTATRVCAEFIDDVENSPFTGMFCCVERSEIPLGLFSSCQRMFRNPPREGEEELGGLRPWMDP